MAQRPTYSSGTNLNIGAHVTMAPLGVERMDARNKARKGSAYSDKSP